MLKVTLALIFPRGIARFSSHIDSNKSSVCVQDLSINVANAMSDFALVISFLLVEITLSSSGQNTVLSLQFFCQLNLRQLKFIR